MLPLPYCVVGLGLAWLVALAAAAAPPPPLRIGTWDQQSDRVVMASEMVLQRAYAKLDQPIEWVEVPIRRALYSLVDGTLDGNVHRAAALLAEQPSLVQVSTPINAVTVRTYTRHGAPEVTHWRDLDGLRLTFSRGTLMIENKLPVGAKRVEASTVTEMFRLLSAGAVDVAIVVEPLSSPPQQQAAAVGVKRQEAVLDQTPLYHYLLGRHRDLAERLNRVLEAMQASGEMKEIQRLSLSAQR